MGTFMYNMLPFNNSYDNYQSMYMYNISDNLCIILSQTCDFPCKQHVYYTQLLTVIVDIKHWNVCFSFLVDYYEDENYFRVDLNMSVWLDRSSQYVTFEIYKDHILPIRACDYDTSFGVPGKHLIINHIVFTYFS